jgi:hypothetical protein
MSTNDLRAAFQPIALAGRYCVWSPDWWAVSEVAKQMGFGAAFNLSLLPLALAILIFDRFDPARGRRRLRKPGFLDRLAANVRRREPMLEDTGTLSSTVTLTPVDAHPSAGGAILAEARLI